MSEKWSVRSSLVLSVKSTNSRLSWTNFLHFYKTAQNASLVAGVSFVFDMTKGKDHLSKIASQHCNTRSHSAQLTYSAQKVISQLTSRRPILNRFVLNGPPLSCVALESLIHSRESFLMNRFNDSCPKAFHDYLVHHV